LRSGRSRRKCGATQWSPADLAMMRCGSSLAQSMIGPAMIGLAPLMIGAVMIGAAMIGATPPWRPRPAQ
jgi:hypothetical protein